MKYLDEVRVINDNYVSEGVKKGDVGTIIFSWIMYYCFEVVFSDHSGKDYAEILINVADLELVKDCGLTDEEILEDLPRNDPKCWCKYEGGKIYNLLGEVKK